MTPAQSVLRLLLSAFLVVLAALSVAGWQTWSSSPPAPGPDGRPILAVTFIASVVGIVVLYSGRARGHSRR
jgi:hypothetical protein